MTIANICGNYQVTITPQTSIQTAAELMETRNVGFLIVTDFEGRPVGVLTDRDIVTKAVASNLPVDDVQVSAIMSKSLVIVDRKSDIFDVLMTMRTHMVRRVIVFDEEQNICGVISSDDLLQEISKQLQLVGGLYSCQGGTKDSHKQHDYTRMA